VAGERDDGDFDKGVASLTPRLGAHRSCTAACAKAVARDTNDDARHLRQVSVVVEAAKRSASEGPCRGRRSPDAQRPCTQWPRRSSSCFHILSPLDAQAVLIPLRRATAPHEPAPAALLLPSPVRLRRLIEAEGSKEKQSQNDTGRGVGDVLETSPGCQCA
jgi:hypothetical protein